MARLALFTALFATMAGALGPLRIGNADRANLATGREDKKAAKGEQRRVYTKTRKLGFAAAVVGPKAGAPPTAAATPIAAKPKAPEVRLVEGVATGVTSIVFGSIALVKFILVGKQGDPIFTLKAGDEAAAVAPAPEASVASGVKAIVSSSGAGATAAASGVKAIVGGSIALVTQLLMDKKKALDTRPKVLGGYVGGRSKAAAPAPEASAALARAPLVFGIVSGLAGPVAKALFNVGAAAPAMAPSGPSSYETAAADAKALLRQAKVAAAAKAKADAKAARQARKAGAMASKGGAKAAAPAAPATDVAKDDVPVHQATAAPAQEVESLEAALARRLDELGISLDDAGDAKDDAPHQATAAQAPEVESLETVLARRLNELGVALA